MNKKILSYIAIIGVVVMLGSCKKFLTQDSLTQALPADYFKTVKDINSSLAGMYSAFQGEMKSNYHYWGECRSDNFTIGGWPNSTINELAVNGLTPANGACSWAGLYTVIGRANNCIKYIPNVALHDNAATGTVINNAMAQCYAMRAMSYFYIIRLWGDAPVWTTPYEDLNQNPRRARAPKDSIMNSVIIPDLLNAYNIIQKGQTPTVWYIGEAAIASMLTDAYMWNKDYANALLWFPKVFAAKSASGKVLCSPTLGPQLTDLGYKANALSTDVAAVKAQAILDETTLWKAPFLTPATCLESIWSINWDFLTNSNINLPVAVSTSNNPVALDSTIFVDWQKNTLDIRWSVTYDKSITARDKMTKYLDKINYTNNQANQYLVMYRLADQILLYAEALNATGNATEALRVINLIRTRAYLAPLLITDPLVSTQAALQTTILNERRLELFGEGKRWFDLIRTNNVITVMDPTLKLRQKRVGALQTGFGDPQRILWPISRQLIEDSQGVLKQNLPY
jgi:starch-binding outer membrane protein, SusD/RagB family